MLAIWLLLASATTLLTAGALYADTVESGSLRGAIRLAPPAQQGVLVRIAGTTQDAGPFDAVVRRALAGAFGASGGEIDAAARSESLAPVGPPSADLAQHLTVLAADEGLQLHATLVSGSWAQTGHQPVEATLSEGAARALGITVGQTVVLADAATPGADPNHPVVTLLVTGTWRPTVDDAFWLGDPLSLTGIADTGTTVFRGPFEVTSSDVIAFAGSGSLDLRWRGIPEVGRLRVGQPAAIAAAVEALPRVLAAGLPAHRFVSVTTELATVLRGSDRSVLVGLGEVILLTLQFAILAGYAVLLVGGMLVERRRADTGLLRSRGASTGQIVALAAGEALLLCIPAALVAPWLALAAVSLLGDLGPLARTGIVAGAQVGSLALVTAAAAGAASVLALTLPTLVAESDLARVRAALGRPLAQTLAQRLGIDLALLVVAIIGLWQLRLYGALLTQDARGTLGLDPLLVASPAFGLAAGAVVATRFVPRLAEIGERLLGRQRGLVSAMGARQVARRPLRYTRSALLLVLAGALGTFAAAYAATWSNAQADQAAYQVVSDVRVAQSAYATIPDWALGNAYQAITGVRSAMPVVRQPITVGRVITKGELLAVNASTPGPLESVRTATGAPPAGTLVGQLAAGRQDDPAIAIPGSPRRLALVVDAVLAFPDPQQVLPADATGLQATIVAQDGFGRLVRIAGSSGPLNGSGARLEVPLSVTVDGQVYSITPPITLRAIEVNITPPRLMQLTGSVTVRGLVESNSASGNDWVPVAFDPSAPGWSWDRIDKTVLGRSGPASTVSSRIDVTPDDFLEVGDQQQAPYFRAGLSNSPDVVPALAGQAFLDQTGGQVGSTIAVETHFEILHVRVVGVVPAFAPLDPTTPFIVVDGPTLDAARYADLAAVAPASEWWLSVDPASEAAVVATVSEKLYSSMKVIDRSALIHALDTDPVALGLLGALALGSIAAAAFAVIGFVVGSNVSIRERLGEFALLRALGLSSRQLSGWLTLEQTFLLVVGLLAGAGIGVLMAWLVLPFALLSDTGASLVPEPIIVVPLEVFAGVGVLAVVVLFATVALVARQVRVAEIGAVLRAGED